MALGELKNGIGPDAYAIYQQVLAAVVERDHPVGSLYISENPTSPAELYGGTWERIKGRFIMGADEDHPAGSTGGSWSHLMSEAEICPHDHNLAIDSTSGSPQVEFPAWLWTFDRTNSAITQLHESKKLLAMRTTMAGSHAPMDITNRYFSMYIWRRVA